MIEAYEIGIRIALDDGVSAGVEAMKRELADLNRQVDASLGHLSGLRLAAEAVVAPSAPDRRPSPAPPAPAPEASEVTTAPAAPASGAAAPTGSEPLGEQPAPAVEPRPAATAAADAVDRIRDSVSSFQAPTAPAAPPSVFEPPAERTEDREPLPSAEPARAPQEGLIGAQDAAHPPPAVPPPRPPDARPVSGAPPLPAAPAFSAEIRIAATALAPTPGTRPTDDGPGAAAPVLAAPPSAPAPEMSFGPPTEPPPAAPAAPGRPRADARAAAPRRLTAAALEGAASPAPMDVHVYLDGSPLGRWMTDHLGRAASRPPASSAAFDPRVSPAWPGAPIV